MMFIIFFKFTIYVVFSIVIMIYKMIDSLRGIQDFIEEKQFFELENLNMVLVTKSAFLELKNLYNLHES